MILNLMYRESVNEEMSYLPSIKAFSKKNDIPLETYKHVESWDEKTLEPSLYVYRELDKEPEVYVNESIKEFIESEEDKEE